MMPTLAGDDQALENARMAGWDLTQGLPPFRHGTPPKIDRRIGHNGIAKTKAKRVEFAFSLDNVVDVGAVLASMKSYNGFIEGSGNRNPWTEELKIGDASYCCAFACLVAFHLGYVWWPECQFGIKGDAYVPYRVAHAIAHGEWQYDLTSKGQPCDLRPGDQPVYAWLGGNAQGDHIETAADIFEDLTFNTVGANTGHPEGVHYPIRRDRKYLLGRVRPSGYYSGLSPQPIPQPLPIPQPVPQPQGDDLVINWSVYTVQFGSKGQYVKNLQGLLCAASRPVLIDGDFGSDTDGALRAWQRDAQVPGGADGVAGEQTWRYLTGFHS